jgi:ankyrin repeat protein
MGDLHDAAGWGDLRKVKALLNGKQNLVGDNDENGWTALMLAAYEGQTDCVRVLLSAGVDINAKEDWRGCRSAIGLPR